MEPTHLSVALMSLNIMHAYHKRNTPLFLAWLATYSTSLLYHYTKWQLHPMARAEQPLFYVDVTAALTLYGVAAREILVAPISPSLQRFLLAFHVFYFLFFGVSKPFDAFMWSSDHVAAERCHAFFHYMTLIQTNLFLAAL